MKTLVCIALAVTVWPVTARAQQKPGAQPRPNFSGRWTVASPAKAAGKEQIVKHDEKTLSTEQVSEGGGRKMVYQLDGVERRMSISASNARDSAARPARASVQARTGFITSDPSDSSTARRRAPIASS